MRWNAAFAYVDPARQRSNLTVRGDALVDRVLFERDRAAGAVVDGEPVHADQIVLSAGACGSPAILLRSGVGPEAELDALGIDVVAPLDGVGSNLQDHVSAKLVFEPSDELRPQRGKRTPDRRIAAAAFARPRAPAFERSSRFARDRSSFAL